MKTSSQIIIPCLIGPTGSPSVQGSKLQVAKLFLPSSSSYRERSQQQGWQKVFGNRKPFHPENQIWESLMLLISLIFLQYWIFKLKHWKKPKQLHTVYVGFNYYKLFLFNNRKDVLSFSLKQGQQHSSGKRPSKPKWLFNLLWKVDTIDTTPQKYCSWHLSVALTSVFSHLS